MDILIEKECVDFEELENVADFMDALKRLLLRQLPQRWHGSYDGNFYASPYDSKPMEKKAISNCCVRGSSQLWIKIPAGVNACTTPKRGSQRGEGSGGGERIIAVRSRSPTPARQPTRSFSLPPLTISNPQMQQQQTFVPKQQQLQQQQDPWDEAMADKNKNGGLILHDDLDTGQPMTPAYPEARSASDR